MKLNKSQGHLAVLTASLIFGLNAPASKYLLGEGLILPHVHIFSRFTGATLLFWLVSCFLPKEKVDKQDYPWLIGASLFGVLFNQGVFAFGISMTSPLNQSLIATAGPIITMLLAALFLKEPITWKKLIGVVMGATGIFMLISSGSHAGTSSVFGDILCAIATTSYALYLAMFKRVIDKYSPVTLMKWMFLFSYIIVLPFTLPKVLSTPWETFDGTFYGILAFVVIGSTFITYLLLPISQKVLRPTVVGMYNYVAPIIATAVALMFGQDTFTMSKLYAAILVVLGVYIVTKSKTRLYKPHSMNTKL